MEISIDLSALCLYWAASMAVRIFMVASVFVHPRLRRQRGLRRDQPPVSVVLPVKQLEPDAGTNLSSVFSQAYPALEVLVSTVEQTSPAIDLHRRIAGQFPQIETRFFTGNPIFTLNPKVSNLAPAIDKAHHGLVLIKDSNIRLAPDQLAELVENLTPDVGLVCSIPIGVSPQGFVAEIECLAMNAYGPPPLLAASIVGWSNCLGKVMLFRRRDFYRAGGVQLIANTFGDDNALGKGFARLGLRTVFSARHVCQSIGRRSCQEVWDRQLRWMMIRRTESPFAFYLEPFAGSVFTALAGSVAAPVLGAPWWFMAVPTLAAWRALDAVVLISKGWGWSWKSPVAGFCWDMIVVILWLRTWFARSVRWGGAEIKLLSRVSE
jgi:ceramide glucosyltransferase